MAAACELHAQVGLVDEHTESQKRGSNRYLLKSSDLGLVGGRELGGLLLDDVQGLGVDLGELLALLLGLGVLEGRLDLEQDARHEARVAVLGDGDLGALDLLRKLVEL